MENAVDALKIAFAVFVFVVGLAVLFYMTSLCQSTATILISGTDETQYYSYIESTEVSGNLVDSNGNRIVDLNDIIPTIYRYYEENYGVTIIDGGEIVARFDADTESAVNAWTTMSDEGKNTLLKYINENILEKTNNNAIDDIESLTDLFDDLYAQDTTSTIRRSTYCYWVGYSSYTAQRIDSDLSRN